MFYINSARDKNIIMQTIISFPRCSLAPSGFFQHTNSIMECLIYVSVNLLALLAHLLKKYKILSLLQHIISLWWEKADKPDQADKFSSCFRCPPVINRHNLLFSKKPIVHNKCKTTTW